MCLIDCAKCCLLKSYFLLIALYRSTCHCLYGLCCWKKVRNERYPWNPIGINYSKIAANIDNISLRPKNEAAEEVHALNHALLAWIKRTTAKKIKTANFGFPIGLPFTFLAIFLKMMIIFVLPMIVLYIIGYYIHWFVTTFRFLLQFVHICVDLIFNQLIKKMAMGFFRDIQVIVCFIRLVGCGRSYSFWSFLRAVISLILIIFGSWFKFWCELMKSFF